jgi:very-short-patch-repair endonuclease
MRLAPTTAESILWEQLKPLGFEQQWILWGRTKNGREWHYIPDFFSEDANLCVEVDGGIHKLKKGYDRRRDTRLGTMGIITLRYTNKEVAEHLDDVVEGIKVVLMERGVTAGRRG